MDFFRPARCATCVHHKLGQYNPEEDYQEHWCEIEENQETEWFSGMHLDNCLFAAIGVPPCRCYNRIESIQDDFAQQHERMTDATTSYSQFKVLIPREEISFEVRRLAQQINEDYKEKKPLLIGILKGSFIFLADLVRFLNIPAEIDFARLSSYGSKKVSAGKIELIYGLQTSVKGRDIIIVDDIVDTGLSISQFIKFIKSHKPSSIKTCALLDKPSRRKTIVRIDYVGITIPDKFVVGYGLDYNEDYRNIPDICILED